MYQSGGVSISGYFLLNQAQLLGTSSHQDDQCAPRKAVLLERSPLSESGLDIREAAHAPEHAPEPSDCASLIELWQEQGGAVNAQSECIWGDTKLTSWVLNTALIHVSTNWGPRTSLG